MQATILLAAVIAYEVVNRVKQADEVRRAALATEATASHDASAPREGATT